MEQNSANWALNMALFNALVLMLLPKIIPEGASSF
jgi:hypothetical protein